jgi:hypothetical protein
MSWEALRWALEQDPGDPDAKWILAGACNFANKQTGKIYAKAQTIADFTNYKDRRKVNRCLNELGTLGLLIDTGERQGGNGNVPVWIWAGFKSKSESQLGTTESQLGTTESQPGAKSAPSFIGKVGLNLEPGTLNPKPKEKKNAEGNSLPSCGNGPLAGPLSSFLSSLSPSQKEAGPEPTWFQEIRAMYLGTDVDEQLGRIEKWANKKKKAFTRNLVLNTLRRHPPKKPGQREGYVYHDKFIDSKQANKVAFTNLEFRLNAKRAIKYADGRIEMH